MMEAHIWVEWPDRRPRPMARRTLLVSHPFTSISIVTLFTNSPDRRYHRLAYIRSSNKHLRNTRLRFCAGNKTSSVHRNKCKDHNFTYRSWSWTSGVSTATCLPVSGISLKLDGSREIRISSGTQSNTLRFQRQIFQHFWWLTTKNILKILFLEPRLSFTYSGMMKHERRNTRDGKCQLYEIDKVKLTRFLKYKLF